MDNKVIILQSFAELILTGRRSQSSQFIYCASKRFGPVLQPGSPPTPENPAKRSEDE
jgi:hypothetical protein